MKFPGRLPLFALFTVAVLSSCAKDNDDKKDQAIVDPSPVSAATSNGRIFFDSSLTGKERGAIETALGFLESNQLLNSEQRLLNIMKIGRGDARTVRDWLETRVQYVINDSTSASKLVSVSKNHQFENPGILPPAFREGANKGSVVMANVGALFYLMGKKKGELLGINADGVGTIPFTSPRAGILIIGDGLLGVVPANQPNAVRAFQLATLLHEARHSDGNKETAGFLHAKCPAGHDYAGQSACDDNLNGPYRIDSLTTKALMNSCVGCSAVERSNLRILYLDSETRVNPTARTEWDDAPEGRRL